MLRGKADTIYLSYTFRLGVNGSGNRMLRGKAATIYLSLTFRLGVNGSGNRMHRGSANRTLSIYPLPLD